ncbi:AI-2E family transporter [Halomonas halocynthiae]|uniref:AI-2E family transporter n=1 Tax=Halomonas halocynthiae TaxID=176290 RepID=UPI0003FC88F8|nr:AI-2E family transporter [Halomonas halocynthiae]
MTRPERKQPATVPLNLMLTLAALVVIIAGMRAGADLLVPLLLSLFIAVVCSAPIHALQRWGVHPRLAVWLTLVVLGALISLLAFLLANSVDTFVEALPGIQATLEEYYFSALTQLSSVGLDIDANWVAGEMDIGQLVAWLPELLSQMGNLLVQSLLVALLAMFLLFEMLSFPAKIANALDNPAPSLRRFSQFNHTLKRYLAVKTLVSLTTGVLVWFACLLTGSEFPLLWAVLAFALNYIPNIGSAIAAVPPVLLMMVSPESGALKALILAGAYLVINVVMGNLVEPRIMGRALGLSTFVAFLSLVVWGWIFGTAGMLLSVVLTMTLKIALESHPQTIWLARLLGSRENAVTNGSS